MNPVFSQAADLATGGVLMGAVTVAFLAFFIIVFLRMFRPAAAAAYAEAAQIPFDGSESTPATDDGDH